LLDVACIVIPFATGGGALARAGAKYGDDVLAAAKTGDNVADAGESINRIESGGDSVHKAGKGFDTFSKAKSELGPAGENKHWHHIVEQCQIQKSGFSPQQIHNTSNLVAVDDSVHVKITAYYNSKHKFTNGLRYRDWLAHQSFEFQYKEGVRVMKLYE